MLEMVMENIRSYGDGEVFQLKPIHSKSSPLSWNSAQMPPRI